MKAHVPPVTTSDVVSFPFEISVPSGARRLAGEFRARHAQTLGVARRDAALDDLTRSFDATSSRRVAARPTFADRDRILRELFHFERFAARASTARPARRIFHPRVRVPRPPPPRSADSSPRCARRHPRQQSRPRRARPARALHRKPPRELVPVLSSRPRAPSRTPSRRPPPPRPRRRARQRSRRRPRARGARTRRARRIAPATACVVAPRAPPARLLQRLERRRVRRVPQRARRSPRPRPRASAPPPAGRRRLRSASAAPASAAPTSVGQRSRRARRGRPPPRSIASASIVARVHRARQCGTRGVAPTPATLDARFATARDDARDARRRRDRGARRRRRARRRATTTGRCVYSDRDDAIRRRGDVRRRARDGDAERRRVPVARRRVADANDSSAATATTATARPRRRVAIFVEPSPFSHVSGMKNRFLRLIENLREMGDDVVVITPDRDPPKEYHGAKVIGLRGFVLPFYGTDTLLCSFGARRTGVAGV